MSLFSVCQENPQETKREKKKRQKNTKDRTSIRSVTIVIICTAVVAAAEGFVHEYEYYLEWMGTHDRKSRKRMFLVPWLECLSLRWCMTLGLVAQEFAQFLQCKESLKLSLVLFFGATYSWSVSRVKTSTSKVPNDFMFLIWHNQMQIEE